VRQMLASLPQATTKGLHSLCFECAQSFIPSPQTTSLETIGENICALKLICADDCKTSVLCHTNLYHFCKTRDFQEQQRHRY
jgi:hypothetical protein